MVRVSAVVPAYNAAETIAATLESILGQTYGDLEAIIVDDGSTDATAAIVAAVAQRDRRVKLLRGPNGGQAVARNRGVAAASGELVAFLDADDTWALDKLADQVDALERHPNAVAVYSWTDYVDEAGQFLHPGSHVSVTGDVAAALVQLNFIENGSSLMARRSALAAVGPFLAELVPSEDWDLWLRLADQGAFAVVPKPQVHYRVSSGSQSANVVRLQRSCQACLRRAFERRPDLVPHRAIALGNLYKYLLAKALEQPPFKGTSPRSLPLALSLLRQLLQYDHTFPRPTLAKVLLRAIALAVLPGPWLRSLDRAERPPWRWGKRWLNTNTILGYIERPS